MHRLPFSEMIQFPKSHILEMKCYTGWFEDMLIIATLGPMPVLCGLATVSKLGFDGSMRHRF